MWRWFPTAMPNPSRLAWLLQAASSATEALETKVTPYSMPGDVRVLVLKHEAWRLETAATMTSWRLHLFLKCSNARFYARWIVLPSRKIRMPSL